MLQQTKQAAITTKQEPEKISALAAYAEGIDHIAIAVENLEEALPFYSNVLGLKVTEQRETKGARTGMRSAVVTGGPLTLVLVQGTSPESQVSRFIEKYGPGVQHVAFKVSNLAAVVKDLKARGMQFTTSVIRSQDLLQIFGLRDEKSGVMVELLERVEDAEVFYDANIDQLFLELETSDHF